MAGVTGHPEGGGGRLVPLAELRRHDGDGAPAWVACDGIVYDVSRSPEWRGGLHRRLHWAGQDLSAELADAPHGRETLERCPRIGRLVESA
jgi:predicted heme/steroid binding protein